MIRPGLRLAILLAASPVALGCPAALERRLYVADRTGLSLYDIDHGHRLLRRIEIPDSGDYKGIAASAPLGRLYLTSNTRDELISLDLATEKEVWRKKLGQYADSPAITPDGRTLYVPYRHDGCWRVLDAETGAVKATIDVGRGQQYDVDPIADIGPHNTWMNRAGTRVYLAVLTLPYVFIADTSTNRVIGKVGPFGKGVRPFAVSDDESHVYASVDGLLGFEIGAVRDGDRWGGPVIQRVQAHTPAERLAAIPVPPPRKPHSTPSHGINIHPNQREVWMVDGVYGYVYAYDVTAPAPYETRASPRLLASIPLFRDPSERPHPGWISFSIDGRYAYPDGGAVVDTKDKTIVARIPTSEKLVEIDFRDGRPVRSGHR